MAKQIKILVVGNGFGGVYAMKSGHTLFHRRRGARFVKLTLIGEKNYFLFTPLLHEVATGGVSPGNIIEPIRKVFDCRLDDFCLGTVTRIDLESQTVNVGDTVIEYDYLVLAPGAETNFYNIPGAKEYGLPLKSLEDAIRIKNQTIRQMERASHTENFLERKKNLTFVVVGGGPTGVEIATELQELIQDNFACYHSRNIIEDASVILIHNGPELVPQFGEKMQRYSLEILQKKGIKVMLGTAVKEVTSSGVILANDMRISTTNVIWVAGIKPRHIHFDQSVERNGKGQIIVNDYLQLGNHPEVFVIGDNAAFKEDGTRPVLPALAQIAEKQAMYVTHTIKRQLDGKKQKPFVYRHTGNLMSLGQWMAVGEIWRVTISGRLTWWLWRMVYLWKMISFRKKVRVAFDWIVNSFTPRDISEF